jgi:hypothetical protein
MKRRGNAALARKARRIDPHLFRTFLTVSFSMVWLGWRQALAIFETLTSFFFTFFKVFLNARSAWRVPDWFILRSKCLARNQKIVSLNARLNVFGGGINDTFCA